MGGKYVAVPPSAIKTDNNRLTLDMTKEQLQQAQAYNLENPNTGSGSTTSPVSGGHIGSVKDLIINKNGRVAAAVIDVGTFLGMGGKYVAVPPSVIKTDNNRLTLDITKEQLQQAQAYNLENPNTGSGSTTSPVTGGHIGSESGTNR
ncbi:MAG: PRC-barrel domain-containing protein [Alphaproteobacteria bacterium]|nr:PRC-barrel domain-containing protein [Alphaproteobacteria bacterium]